MNDDAALLRRYADEGSEAAFAELVRRHVDLVYGAALRRTGGDTHRAADVAQQVFTTLARDARKLSRHAVLGAWLHTATRNAALNLMISEQRRQARETQALALEPTMVTGDASPDWDRLRTVIDAAIDELPESDRAAVVLRFLEKRAFAEIGAALRVSEDAARMRTDRALDKLRTALARRGITSTAAALGAIVSSQPVMSAPAGLAAALAAQSLATATTGAGLFATLVSFMNQKIITTAALSAFIFFGVGAYVGTDHSVATTPPAESPRQARMIASLGENNERLRAEVASLSAEVARLNATNAELAARRAAPPPRKGATLGFMPRYERERTIMNYLRQIDAARDQYILENSHPPASVHELVGIDSFIKTVRPVSGEDYSGVSMGKGQPLSVTTEDGITVTYDPSGATTTPIERPAAVVRFEELQAQEEELGKKTEPIAQKAVEAYRAGHNGNRPPNPEALIPYFSTPQEGADWVEFLKAGRAVAEAQAAAMEAQKAAPR